MPDHEDLRQQLEYMYGLERFGIRLGLEAITELMETLDNPHQTFSSIHITGTTGKGSTASMIAAILQQTGRRVGCYTSPHLHRFNERVSINGEQISDAQLGNLMREIRQVTEKRAMTVTFFEFTTAIAFLYFARKKVDSAVIEVGLGGLLDATNVISPTVSVITNVGYDHTEILGHTTMDIARNKAGIIKKGVPVVTAEHDPAINEYFESICRQRDATLYHVPKSQPPQNENLSLEHQQFDYNNETYTLKLLGRHQVQNALTAVVTAEVLSKQGIAVTIDDCKAGLANATWEGRLDIIRKEPLVLVDGAHNEDSFAALREFLDHTQLPHRATMLVALKKDKRVGKELTAILQSFDHVIITEGTYEPTPAAKLAQEVQKFHQNVEAIPGTREATQAALTITPPKDMLLITGSLYMIGEAIETVKNEQGA